MVAVEAAVAVWARPPALERRIKLVNCPRNAFLRRYHKKLESQHHRLSLCCAVGVPNEKPFKELDRVMIGVQSATEAFWNTYPKPIKEFPWKKAGDIFVNKLFEILKKTFKWIMISFFVFNCVLDVVISVAKNGELMIPLGLSIGFILADFFKETLQAMFQEEKEKKFLWHLVSIASLFVLLKLIYVPNRGQMLISHVSNGGLLKVLWLRKKFWLEEDEAANKAVNNIVSDTEKNQL